MSKIEQVPDSQLSLLQGFATDLAELGEQTVEVFIAGFGLATVSVDPEATKLNIKIRTARNYQLDFKTQELKAGPTEDCDIYDIKEGRIDQAQLNTITATTSSKGDPRSAFFALANDTENTLSFIRSHLEAAQDIQMMNTRVEAAKAAVIQEAREIMGTGVYLESGNGKAFISADGSRILSTSDDFESFTLDDFSTPEKAPSDVTRLRESKQAKIAEAQEKVHSLITACGVLQTPEQPNLAQVVPFSYIQKTQEAFVR